MHDPIRLYAIDWGTSTARAYALDAAGKVLDERSAPLGIQRITDGNFAAALASLCEGAATGVPMLACGMIGSRQGWVEAPYCDCPAGFDAIASGLTPVPQTRLAIVPGLICRDAHGVPDVMRGEETQLFGAFADDACARQVVVLPGTHSKWAIVDGQAIEAFTTFMTGELFALLREHSILGRMIVEGSDRAAFERGVAASLRDDAALTRDLFSARTLPLTGALASAGVADYLSGLLLGAEIAAARCWMVQRGLGDAGITLIGDAALCGRYRMALSTAGIRAELGPAAAAARGLWRIAHHAGLLQA